VTSRQNIFFDDGGQPTAVTWPEYSTDDPEADDDQARLRREIVTRLLVFLATSGTASAIGRKCVLYSWLAGLLPDVRTQADLARHMELTPGRVSQLLNALRQGDIEFSGLFRRHHRKIKHRGHR
jgi:hypothetical protein